MSLQAVVDRHLRTISMYRTVSIALSILWGYSFVLSVLGVIAYNPVQISLSVIVLILATVLSNYAFGCVVRTHTHPESAFITALILFFIVSPTSSVEGLSILALLGVVASVSKYLIAYRGRHIFNPAAIAAVIIGMSGLASISWWVATPALAIITAVLAAVILYKTHRMRIGLTFIALVAVPIFMILSSSGLSVSQSALALFAWPILFLVGFMLTEPLTLPAKKWQLYIEVVIVAVLFIQSVVMDGYSIPPALALVIGNLFAFAVSRRQSIEMQLVDRRSLTPTTDEFVFKPKTAIRFEPGQYMEIMLPHKGVDSRGLRRAFSVSSASTDSSVTFGVKFYEPTSSFKSTLRNLPIGSTVKGINISGDFTLPSNPNMPLVFIAGGIGITPFISHIKSLMASDSKMRDIVLLYAVSGEGEIAYMDILMRSGIKVVIVSGAPMTRQAGFDYIQSSQVTGQVLREAVKDIGERQVYVSGPPAMVSSARRSAVQLGVKRIKTDYFTGY